MIPIGTRGLETREVLMVKAANFDTRPVFLTAGVSIDFGDDTRFGWIGFDQWGNPLAKTALAPGDAHTVSVRLENLRNYLPGLRRFFFHDELGREYSTDPAQVAELADEILRDDR